MRVATLTGSASTRSSSALRPFRYDMLCSQGGPCCGVTLGSMHHLSTPCCSCLCLPFCSRPCFGKRFSSRLCVGCCCACTLLRLSVVLRHFVFLPRLCVLLFVSLAPHVRIALQGLTDALFGENRADAASIGRRCILPATFIGGPRYCQQKFQDAQAMVRALSKPRYFLNMTCNPACPEIKEPCNSASRHRTGLTWCVGSSSSSLTP